jgi:acetyl esterase/lipase
VIDVRTPPGAARGLVIFLHGGFWRNAFDRAHVGPLAAGLAAAGYVVATPEYRRTGAPGGGWPGTFDDVAAAVRVGRALADQRTGAPILAGHSAGGHLALWAAAGLVREGAGVRGVLALAPVADLAGAYERDLDRGAAAALLGGGPGDVPERYAAADPMALLPLGMPQVICHGDRDAQVPVEMSRDFAAAALAAGDEVILLEWPRVDHFAVIDPESAVWPDVKAAIERL